MKPPVSVPAPAVPTAPSTTSSAPPVPSVIPDTDDSDVAADVPSAVESSPPAVPVAAPTPSAPIDALTSEAPCKEDEETTKLPKPTQKDASQVCNRNTCILFTKYRNACVLLHLSPQRQVNASKLSKS